MAGPHPGPGGWRPNARCPQAWTGIANARFSICATPAGDASGQRLAAARCSSSAGRQAETFLTDQPLREPPEDSPPRCQREADARVLWEHENVEGGGQLPNSPEQLAEMKNRFPPRELEGMESGFYWYPPKRKKQTKKRGRLNQARYDELKRERLKRAQSINTLPTRYRPIDESVKIPEAVRRAAAQANSL